MTEAEWLAADDVRSMLARPAVASNQRKLRLFTVACTRLLADWIENPRVMKAIDAAERYAEGQITPTTLHRWWNEIHRADASRVRPSGAMWGGVPDPQGCAYKAALWTTCRTNFAVAWVSAVDDILTGNDRQFGVSARAFRTRYAGLLVDVYGNPFHPITFSPSWRIDTALALAHQMYDSRDFGAMPILADALQDAGCDNDGILNHCRAPGVHVRGCWVVDLALGKE